jgi:hypothetical protein
MRPEDVTKKDLNDMCDYIIECGQEVKSALPGVEDDEKILDVSRVASGGGLGIAKGICDPDPNIIKIRLMLWLIDALYRLLKGDLDELPPTPTVDPMS